MLVPTQLGHNQRLPQLGLHHCCSCPARGFICWDSLRLLLSLQICLAKLPLLPAPALSS
jgi:hypothetical protein